MYWIVYDVVIDSTSGKDSCFLSKFPNAVFFSMKE